MSLAAPVHADSSRSSSVCRAFVTLSPALARVAEDLVGSDALSARLKGVSAFSSLSSRVSFPAVASAGRIDTEKVLSLAPDCAFVARGVLPTEVVERFERIARKASRKIRIITVTMDSLAQIAQGYVAIGRELGVENRGMELAQAFRAKIESFRGRLQGVRAFIQVDDQPLVAVGGTRTFLSEVFEHLGVVNVMSGIREAYPRVSVESVAAASPDRIWILGEPSEASRFEAMASAWRTRFPSLKVVKSGGVRVVLSRELTLPSMSLVSAMERLVQDEGR
jgi:iron complex transport system substrate-binding protein